MTLRQRDPRREDAKHLAYIRKQPCCVCGKPAPSEAAHIRMRRADMSKDIGMGEKPHDMHTTPLCNWHHVSGPKAQHKMNEAAFWRMHGLDPFAIALRLWHESGGEYRSHLPSAPVMVRPIAPRKPIAQRKKIQGRSEIQSRSFAPAPKPRTASRPITRKSEQQGYSQ